MTAAAVHPESTGWRGRVSSHPIPVALAACWRASRGLTVALLVLAIGRGIVPNLLYVGTSALAGSLATGGGDTAIAAAIVGITVAFFVLQTSDPLLEQVSNAVGRLVDADLQRSVIAASLEPATIGHLDTEAFRQATTTARDWENSPHPPSAAVGGLAQVLMATTWAVVSGLFIIQFVWWAPLVVMAGWLTMTSYGTRFREGPALARMRSATPLRRATYYRDLAFEAPSAREARIFGLGAWLRDRSERQWQAGMERIWAARSATRALGLSGAAILVAGYFVLFGLIMQAAFDGTIDVVHASLYVQACGGIAYLWMPWAILSLKEATAPIPQLTAAVTATTAARATAPAGTRDPAGMPRTSIALRGISFTYPGQPNPVYRGLDLTIEAGHSIAIVGANGAGKTTLVKLLCGLLDVDAGEITVDGEPFRELDRSRWQRRVAAIFQDFVRYPFSARDNIALGAMDASGGRPAVGRALDRAMAGETVRDLPDGLDTTLAREFGGVDLSGGQWQRIALARALYAVERGASVLILDEPTAHLDIRAEAELFDRFLDLTRGLTTILISHRFSSVRHAERIVVLAEGRIVEDGTHASLVAAGGLYEQMFREQARHFADAP